MYFERIDDWVLLHNKLNPIKQIFESKNCPIEHLRSISIYLEI